MHGAVHRAGDQQSGGRVERGRGYRERQRLAVLRTRVGHAPLADKEAGTQVPRGHRGVRGHSDQQVEQSAVYGFDHKSAAAAAAAATDAAVVKVADVLRPWSVDEPVAHTAVRGDRAVREHQQHAHGRVEARVRPERRRLQSRWRRPYVRIQARGRVHVPRLQLAVGRDRIQARVALVMEHVHHLRFVAGEPFVMWWHQPFARAFAGHVPEPDHAVSATGNHARVVRIATTTETTANK